MFRGAVNRVMRNVVSDVRQQTFHFQSGCGLMPKPCAATSSWQNDAIYSPLLPAVSANINGSVVGAAEMLQLCSSALDFQLFGVQTHIDTCDSLLRVCRNIAPNRSNGTFMHALQGPRGIGKTTIMRAFTAGCQAAFPHIIPMYITYTDWKTNNTLVNNPIGDIMLRQLVQRGVLKQEEVSECRYPMTAVYHGLTRTGHKLLLLVDDVDDLFRTDARVEQELASITKQLIQSLTAFAALPVGRVVICGAAPFLRNLSLYGLDPDSAFAKEFPSCQLITRLNSLRVNPCAPVDLRVARAVLEAVTTTPVNVGMVRLAAFIGGGNPHALTLAAQTGFAVNRMLHPLQTETEQALNAFNSAFLSALMYRMWLRNAPLLESMLQPGTDVPGVIRVMYTEWERFVPLTLAECVQIFHNLVREEGSGIESWSGHIDIKDVLDTLSDAELLILTQTASASVRVFPGTVSQLFVYNGRKNTGSSASALCVSGVTDCKRFHLPCP